MTSPLVALTDDDIVAELQRIDHEVNDGTKGASSKMPDLCLSGLNYDHSEAAILAGTAHEGRAGPDCKTSHTELVEPAKKESKGLQFADVVGGLVGELSTFIRKTSTPGEIFPLPVDSVIDQPFLSHLPQGVRTVLRAVVFGGNDVYDCRPFENKEFHRCMSGFSFFWVTLWRAFMERVSQGAKH